MSTRVLTESTDEGLHYMPDDGKHEASSDCWCHPVLTRSDDEDGRGTWVHLTSNKGQ